MPGRQYKMNHLSVFLIPTMSNVSIRVFIMARNSITHGGTAGNLAERSCEQQLQYLERICTNNT